MTEEELSQVVDQPAVDPRVLGRLACNLRQEGSARQHNYDGNTLTLTWKEMVDVSRCCISLAGEKRTLLAQVDVHENATVMVEVYAPCRVTVSPEEGFLCLTRFRSA